jgi:hypothetical protein
MSSRASRANGDSTQSSTDAVGIFARMYEPRRRPVDGSWPIGKRLASSGRFVGANQGNVARPEKTSIPRAPLPVQSACAFALVEPTAM